MSDNWLYAELFPGEEIDDGANPNVNDMECAPIEQALDTDMILKETFKLLNEFVNKVIYNNELYVSDQPHNTDHSYCSVKREEEVPEPANETERLRKRIVAAPKIRVTVPIRVTVSKYKVPNHLESQGMSVKIMKIKNDQGKLCWGSRLKSQRNYKSAKSKLFCNSF